MHTTHAVYENTAAGEGCYYFVAYASALHLLALCCAERACTNTIDHVDGNKPPVCVMQ